MEKLKIYLYSTRPASDKKMRWSLGILGFLYIPFGILTIYYKYENIFSYLAVIVGVFSMIYALAYQKLVKRCHITLDDECIKAALFKAIQMKSVPFKSPSLNINIRWDEIKSINIELLKISINLNDGSSKEIELGDLTYRQHRILKEKLQNCMSDNKIEMTN